MHDLIRSLDSSLRSDNLNDLCKTDNRLVVSPTIGLQINNHLDRTEAILVQVVVIVLGNTRKDNALPLEMNAIFARSVDIMHVHVAQHDISTIRNRDASLC